VGFLADWILRRVVKSALVFEAGSLGTYRQLRERLVDILAKHTGQDAERIRRDSDRNFFMSAEEAQAYGIIDQVITRKLEIVKK